jgi:hypothetical protein
VRFSLTLVWKTGTFLQILNLISLLRMQEMVLAGFKFQKFYGGACPRTPLGRAWPSATHVHFIQNATVRLRRWIRPWYMITYSRFRLIIVSSGHVTSIYSVSSKRPFRGYSLFFTVRHFTVNWFISLCAKLSGYNCKTLWITLVKVFMS